MNDHEQPPFCGSRLSRRMALVQWGGATVALIMHDRGMARLSLGSAELGRDPTDDDALLARVLSSPKPLIASRQQPYRITRTLPIAAGRNVLIEPGARILWVGPSKAKDGPIAVFEAMGDGCGLAVAGKGVAVVACETPSLLVYAAMMRGRRGFSVTGIQAEDCQHVHIYSSVGDYSSVRTGTNGTIAHDVRISGGGARFRKPPAENGNGACMLAYVANAHVTDVRYENVTSGVQWWGGDAGLQAGQNGARINERKCRDILIERAVVNGARVGGVWGSMGRDVTVRDCTVEESLDVGYDAEGCDDVVFERCTARNAHNGCFTTFALCSGIRFVDCRGSVDRRSYPILRVYNVTQSSADNRDITVEGGRFECLDPAGPSTMDSAMGPVRDLTITGATLTNVRIDTAYFNMHRTRIAGNQLTFTAPLDALSAIRAGSSKGTPAESGSVVVENNRISYNDAHGAPAAQGTSAAIEIMENDFNSNASGRIAGNTVSGGFSAGISLTNATLNIGVVPTFTVTGNRFRKLAHGAHLLAIRQIGAAKHPSVQWGQGQTRDGKVIALNAALGRH